MSLYDTDNTPDSPVTSPLTVYPGGGKWLEAAPDGFRVGAIRLRGWDLHSVKPLPAEYAEQDVYLAKLVYDLELEPEASRPLWMEVGFSFESDDGPEPAAGPRATVLDALPRTVVDTQRQQGYRLNRSLMFVPHDDASACVAFLDDVEPTVDVFGIGSPEIRWRHTATRKAPLRLGSRVCWISLAAPAGTQELTVEVKGRFELRGKDGRPWTASEPVRFPLALRPSGTAEPALAAAPTRPGPGNPKVFICYAHDNPEHRDLVRNLADFLAEQGCDITLDAYEPPVRGDWDGWATKGILHTDFVAVIASPRMRAVGDGEVGPDENRGLQSELKKLSELLQRNRPAWTRRILPVVLNGYRVEDIPLMFHGYIEDHYKITAFTPEGAKSFLDTVFHEFGGQRPFIRPLTT